MSLLNSLLPQGEGARSADDGSNKILHKCIFIYLNSLTRGYASTSAGGRGENNY